MPKDNLLILGCGKHGKVSKEIAQLMGYKDISYLDEYVDFKEYFGSKVLNRLQNQFTGDFFVAIGDNYTRHKAYTNFIKENPNANFVSLIHPSSIISDSAKIGKGSIVMPRCSINTNTNIGNGVIINTASIIEHDNNIGDFCSISPGCVTGGSVDIGTKSAICIGAVIIEKIKVGKSTVVGANSTVLRNIPDNVVSYGSPSKIIRKRNDSDKYMN